MSTTITPAETMSPRRGGFNWRVALFVGMIMLVIGGPIYLYLDSVISGGIKDRGTFFEVDLKAMSSFTFDQMAGRLEDVPEKWRELDGKVIEVKGEIAPGGFEARGVDTAFQLVYSVAKCCFTGRPLIQHFVQITVPPNAVITPGVGGDAQPIRIRGTLRVDVVRDEATGAITGVYHIRAQRVERV